MSDATAPVPTRPRRDLLALLRDPQTIRLRCAAVTRAVEQGRSGYFKVDRRQLDVAAERVEALMRARFPDLKIPLHSRWRHFEAGGVDRKAELDAALAGRDALERLRAQVDLTIISVLLDAGAGAQWRYVERRELEAMAKPVHQHGADDLLAMLDQAAKVPAADAVPNAEPAQTEPPAAGNSYTRSEGLGVASFRAFLAGAFSAQRDEPLRADAATLKLIDAPALRAMFQSTPGNPLVGLEGRAQLMARLGQALVSEAARDGADAARPSLVTDRLTQQLTRREISATELLQELLRTLAPIWPASPMVMGVPAGDTWPHRWAGRETVAGLDPTTEGWVPFHKLSQWMTYSLLEPLQWAGVQVTGLAALTGLPEYRNGGLLIDCGVIVPRTPSVLKRTYKPGDECVVEWRALTVTLLDDLAQRVRGRLGKSEDELPLPCILEGGTWAAGRAIAQELRGGTPPLQIDSDGTVF